MDRAYNTEILIAGGSFGGVSAALAACKAGRRVIMTEETGWIGGQATAQGVPLDEHPWMEQYGSPASYREFRARIRDYYRRNYPLTAHAMRDPHMNPGACWVSALGFEPRAGLHVLEEMLAPYRTAGLLKIWLHMRPLAVEMEGDRIRSVTFQHTRDGRRRQVSAEYVLDATELGDLLPLGGIEHVIGAEAQRETGEPLAAEKADPRRQQPFTHLIALDYLPGEEHVIDKPAHYERYRAAFEKVTGMCESLRAGEIIGSGMPKGLFAPRDDQAYVPDLWNFRRYFYQGNFDGSLFASDITALMVGNEYKDGVLCGVCEEEARRHMQGAREMTLSLVHYLQTEAPRPGGRGFPGIHVREDVIDTEDGLAQYPYIRESRRIRAEYTIVEQDFLIHEHPDGPVQYADTVGLAGYRIDIHEKARGSQESITSAVHAQHWTQQIPLGALIPVRVENLLACGKNIGTTHVTNGAYRLHPVEWNIGEAAGSLAAYCLRKGNTPRGVRNTPRQLEDFQSELIRRGVELAWPRQTFGQSYFSCMRKVAGWYFGEADKLASSVFIPGEQASSEGKNT